MITKEQSLENYRRAWDTAKAYLDLPEPILVSKWADDHRYLSSEASSKRGKWVSLPMQREPMDAVLDPQVESICLMWSSQTAGKTELLLNILGYYIQHDPCPMLVLQPTIEMAETFSKDRLAPMVRDTPILRGIIRDPRERDSGNTILHKRFPGGHVTFVGANAPASLASRPIRVVLCDEIDRYPASAGPEGDPISLAVKRTDTFFDAVMMLTSTPTIKGMSRIESEFELSDKRHWHCPCPICDEWQVLRWAQVQWEPNKPETAVYVCTKCQTKLIDEQRVGMIMRGEWRPTAEFKGRRGYHLSGIYSVFPAQKGFSNRLHQMAAQFLDSKRLGDQSLKTWINTFLAETYEAESEKIEFETLMDRCETYGPGLPAAVLVLVAGVDVQADRIEVEVVGYGLGEESWGVRYQRIYGDPEQETVWADLDSWLLRDYEHPSGKRLRVACACVDAGSKPQSVYRYTKPRSGRRIWAVKGSSVAGGPLVSRPQRSSVRDVPLFAVSTDTAKEVTFSRLRIAEKGPRYCHFPAGFGYTEEYFSQLTAEKVVTEWSRGKPTRRWVKMRDRNEALDLRVYALAALDLLNPDWEALKKSLDSSVATVESAATGPKPAVAHSLIPAARRKSWVNGWR